MIDRHEPTEPVTCRELIPVALGGLALGSAVAVLCVLIAVLG